MDLRDGLYSLFRDINKVHVEDNKDTDEGVISELLPELELSMSDDELIALKKKWEKNWEDYNNDIKRLQTENEAYWQGNQHSTTEYKTESKPLTDNLIFEALETYLPLATKNNPEPMVLADNTDSGNAISDVTQKMLVYQADRLSLNLKLMRVARNWALYLLGVAKVGWDMIENDITVVIPRPQKLILDPDATINDDCEYTGEYIGEYRKDKADILIKRFPNKKDFLTEEVGGKLATEVQYIEWWTNDYVFWTLDSEVLGKAKNPHWNYEEKVQTVNEFGQTTEHAQEGKNFFKTRKKPYIFLSVFNLGKHPHDDTSLVGQNISRQNVINKRARQIDRNVDWMNGGWAVSGDKSGLTRDQAASAIEAARKGGGLWIPQGNPNEAVVRMTGTGLPADVFNQQEDSRQELRNSFGIRGSTAEGTESEKTVRGKMITKGQDGDRIGGGVTRYLERFAAQTFKWCVQLMYVNYDEPHYASIVGREKAQESFYLQKDQFGPALTVTVKEGSLIPKDSLTKANQAIDLASQGFMDPLTLFTRLDDANPKETAGRLMLFKADPVAYMQKYFPDIQLQAPPQEEKLPSESISYADLPPEAQSQMLAKVGIQVAPQDIAVQNVASEVIKHGAKSAIDTSAAAQLQAAKPGPTQNTNVPTK
jgi:hypothetical protein